MNSSNISKHYIDFRARFDDVGNRRKDKTLFTCMCDDGSVKKYTFGEVYNIIRSVETEFEKIGFKKGDRAAVVSPLSVETLITGIAMSYAGITAVLVDASLPVEELERLISFSDVRAIFTNDVLHKQLSECFNGKVDFFRLIGSGQLQRFENENNNAPLILPETVDGDTDVISVIFSSGTTGTMKGVQITYNSIVKSADIFTRLLGEEENRKILYVFPFNHIAGYDLCYMFMFRGWELGLIENMNATKLQKTLLEFEPHAFAIVPKVFEVFEQKIRSKIQEKGKFVEKVIEGLLSFSYFMRKNFGINIGRFLFKGIRSKAFGKDIQIVGGGGTKFKASNARFFFSLGLDWVNVYASTETGVPCIATGMGDRHIYDVLGNAYKNPEIEIAIGNKDENGQGEILVKSELVMKGYFRRPDFTAEAFDENGYFRTGDSGYIDKRGDVHITGRIKESIILQSGKKVSPADVDMYYMEKIPNYEIASKGVLDGDKQYDTIHMFIQDDNFSPEEKEQIRTSVEGVSRTAPSMYQLSGIHFVRKIEKTSIGKVKRFLLKPEDEAPIVMKGTPVRENAVLSTEERFLDIIKKKCAVDSVFMEQDLKNDLGADSLTIYEIITELESAFHVELASVITQVYTVGGLYEIVTNSDKRSKKAGSTIDMSNYPMEKTDKDIKKFVRNMKRVHKLWNIEVEGIENVGDENYIICPNHESHFDGLFVYSALYNAGKIDPRRVCCMAKMEHLYHRITTNWLKMLGGIPVDRLGMSAPALQRSRQCINNGFMFLIHPEGTRTRDGKLGAFKSGAAKLATETNKKILPVRIDGAYALYPHTKLLPKLFDWRHFRKCRLKISFAKPIEKGNMTAGEMTSLLRDTIVTLGDA